MPDRRLILVADSAFAALDLTGAIRGHVCPITRLRLDAHLFEPAPPRRPGRRGRPPLKGARLPRLVTVLADPATVWTTPVLPGLFSLITVRADSLVRIAPITLRPNTAARYRKREPTFSDAIAAVRRVLWCPPDFSMSRWIDGTITIPATLLKRLVQTLCLAA